MKEYCRIKPSYCKGSAYPVKSCDILEVIEHDFDRTSKVKHLDKREKWWMPTESLIKCGPPLKTRRIVDILNDR